MSIEHVNTGKCDNPNCGGSCHICCCFVCMFCLLSEGALTTHCPGKLGKLHSVVSDAVYAGVLDFRINRWVLGYNNTNQMWKRQVKTLCGACYGTGRVDYLGLSVHKDERYNNHKCGVCDGTGKTHLER